MTENVPAVPQEELSPDRPVALFTEDENLQTLVSIVDERMSKSFLAFKDNPQLKDFFDLDEARLYKKLRKENVRPSSTDNMLRLAFWREYDRCLAQGYGKMKMTHVYAGVCTHEYFYHRYIKNPFLVAWLLCPPASYEKSMDEALSYGTHRMRKILGYDDFDAKGRPNIKLMELKVKIHNMIDQRKKGGVLQRSQAVNLNLSDNSANKRITEHTVAEIEEKIKRLEEKAARGKKVIDVEIEQVDT